MSEPNEPGTPPPHEPPPRQPAPPPPESAAPPPPPPHESAATAASSGVASQEDKTLAMLTHLSGIILSFIVPLVIWLINKDKPEKGYLTEQAKEALNFQITVAIAYVVCWVLTAIIIGALLMPLVWIANLIFCILAGVKANEGAAYRYPLALRLIN